MTNRSFCGIIYTEKGEKNPNRKEVKVMYQEWFEVAIEGIVYCFTTAEEAFDEYEQLLQLGYYEAVLRKKFKGYDTVLVWNKRAGTFFEQI